MLSKPEVMKIPDWQLLTYKLAEEFAMSGVAPLHADTQVNAVLFRYV